MTSTKHWYLFDEVVSSLQKCIRRGLMNPAIFWAGELYSSDNQFFLFKKIFTISVEDIGLADPEVVLYAHTLYHQWVRDPNPTLCVKLIKLLVLAKKSRLVPNLLIYLTSLRKPPNPIEQIDFNEFAVTYPETAGYISSVVSREKNGLTTDNIDIFSALVQFVSALSKREQDNAFFFAHLLGLVNIQTDLRHEIVGHLVGKLSDLNASKSSIIVWGILTNKMFLRELGVKPGKIIHKLLKRLYIINAYGLGNSNYNLLFAVSLIMYSRLSSVDHETFAKISTVSPEELQLFKNNGEGESIFDRRKFAVPNFAVDLNTKRGRGCRGSKKSTTYYLYYYQNQPPKDCIVPKLEDWSLKEICKSHGGYKNYVQCSHVLFSQLEGNKLVNESESIYDCYYNAALKILLDIEEQKNYTYTKYTKMARFITEDVLKTQNLWIVLPNRYLACNPLQFDNTEIHDTHLYKHEIFDTDGSALMSYPEGFCPVRVYLTPFTKGEFFEYANKLKKMLTRVVPVEAYHTINLQTSTGQEKYLVIKKPPKLKKFTGNIYGYLANYELIISYVLLKLFQIIVGAQTDDDSKVFRYSSDTDQVISFVETPASNRGPLPPLIDDLITEYRYEFLFTVKEWYNTLKSSTELSDRVKEVYLYISNA